jgi:hypothetical protein
MSAISLVDWSGRRRDRLNNHINLLTPRVFTSALSLISISLISVSLIGVHFAITIHFPSAAHLS